MSSVGKVFKVADFVDSTYYLKPGQVCVCDSDTDGILIVHVLDKHRTSGVLFHDYKHDCVPDSALLLTDEEVDKYKKTKEYREYNAVVNSLTLTEDEIAKYRSTNYYSKLYNLDKE